MKYLAIYILILLIACTNNKTDVKTQSANTSATENKQEQTVALSSSGNGIVGEWEQQYTSFDKNGNYKLEPDEKSLRIQDLVLIGFVSMQMAAACGIKTFESKALIQFKKIMGIKSS